MVFNACEWDLLREFNGCFQEKLDFNGTFMIFINALCYRYGIHWILYGLICYPKKFITQKYHLQTKIYNGETRASQQCKTQCERLNNVFVHFTSLIILSLILWTILSSHFLSLILWTIPHEPQKDPKRLSRLVRAQTNRIATTKVVATNFPISPSFPILSVGQMLPQFLLHFVFLRALLLLLFSLSLNGLLLLKSFALALGWSDELQRLPWGQGELVQQFNGEYTLR